MAFVAVHGTDELEGFTEDEEETVSEMANPVATELFDKIHGSDSGGGDFEATVHRTQTQEAIPHDRVPQWDADEFEGGHEKGGWFWMRRWP